MNGNNRSVSKTVPGPAWSFYFWLKVMQHPDIAVRFFLQDDDCFLDYSGGEHFSGPYHLTDAFGDRRQLYIRDDKMDEVRERLELLLNEASEPDVRTEEPNSLDSEFISFDDVERAIRPRQAEVSIGHKTGMLMLPHIKIDDSDEEG